MDKILNYVSNFLQTKGFAINDAELRKALIILLIFLIWFLIEAIRYLWNKYEHSKLERHIRNVGTCVRCKKTGHIATSLGSSFHLCDVCIHNMVSCFACGSSLHVKECEHMDFIHEEFICNKCFNEKSQCDICYQWLPIKEVQYKPTIWVSPRSGEGDCRCYCQECYSKLEKEQ